MAKLQHRNLVRLWGFWLEGDEKIFVYEYVPNKSLDYFLFDPTKRSQLDWPIRCNVIEGVARGILHLHEDSRLKIIHRDLKASIILLDKDMTPKISDFGVAKMLGVDQIQVVTWSQNMQWKGYIQSNRTCSVFGVLLLEILSGRSNTGFHYLMDSSSSLVAYAWQLWNAGEVLELMDPLMKDWCPPNELKDPLGYLCVQEDANKRPTMFTVVLMLKSESLNLYQPERPAFFVGRFTPQHRETASDDICSVNAMTVSDFCASMSEPSNTSQISLPTMGYLPADAKVAIATSSSV